MNKLFSFTAASAMSLVGVLQVGLLQVGVLQAQNLSGVWDGTIKYDQISIPFKFEIAGSGDQVRGSFFNGEIPVTSTTGRLNGKTLTLNFDHLGSRLEATVEDGAIEGTFGGKRSGAHEVELKPHHEVAADAAKAPQIAGVWEIPTESRKGEHAWRFIVQQDGAKASAAILRVDGDTGLLTGAFRDGKFRLSHFDGGRPENMDITPKEDGSLEVSVQGTRGAPIVYNAVKPAVAEAKGIVPADFAKHTGVKDPSQPFAFSFPDLNGKLVSNTDPQFRGKVIVVNITGSWCPNCNDEAPYLVELYRKYHALGLEIVALDFEDAEERKDPSRLPAFISHYGIEYTYLLAGETSELNAKIPQAENLNSWPTTFFIGRDGKFAAAHAGFAGEASGAYHEELTKEYTSTIERLLTENIRAAK
jgi:thiol-disulfide isomerase/thioredoxin